MSKGSRYDGRMRREAALIAGLLLLPTWATRADESRTIRVPIDGGWQRMSIFEGSNIYYQARAENGMTYLHADYHPPQKTVTFVRKIPTLPGNFDRFRFRWRVFKFPVNGDEALPGHRDNAASVYLLFKDGVKDYVIKYVFSTAHARGFNFRDAVSGLFTKMQIVVLEDNYREIGRWQSEDVDFRNDFRNYFGVARVPPLRGIGVLSDGDGTKSEVIADYADFTFVDSSGEKQQTTSR